MKIILFVITALCGILSLSFLFTMLCGIVNAGNIIGLICCLIVIFTILLYLKYNKYKAVRLFSRIVAICGGICGGYALIISMFIFSAVLNTPQTALQTGSEGIYEPHTVIVLGCKTIDGNPSVMLKARLDTAIEYLNENPQAVCVVTGGQGSDEIEPEAVTMERYMITKGINKSRIYTETNSTNTKENLMFSKEIIKEQNLPADVVIVSEIYHVYRGVRNAEKNGLNACSLPAPTNTPWAVPSYWVREIFAVTRDYIVER